MDTKNKEFESLKTNCLDYLRFMEAAIRFGDPQNIEKTADELRSKLFALSSLADQLKR